MRGLIDRLLGGGSRQATDFTGGGMPFRIDPLSGLMHGGPSSSGTFVDGESAMRVSAVFACVRILAESVAMPALAIKRRLGKGKGTEEDPGHPLYEPLRYSPNRYQTSFEWREMSMGHLALRGNAYSEIVPGSRGAVDQLIPMHPDRVVVEVNNGDGYREAGKDTTLEPGGRIRYIHRRIGMPPRTLADEQVYHIRGLSSNGIKGLSVLEYARDTIGLAQALEKHGAGLFSRGTRLSGVLQTKGTLKPDALQRIRESWMAMYGGVDNAHRTAILEEGLEWKQIGLSNDDAQFLESRKFSVTEIARWFRVPPHMIGDLERSTNNNIEHQSLEFVRYCLQPWLERWTQAIARDLITNPKVFFAEFDVDSLLRGDVKNQAEANGIYVDKGVLTRNDVREVLGKNPLPGLDTPMQPLSMGLVGEEVSQEKRIEAVGALIRAGFTPEAAAEAVGLPAMEHIGLPPVTVQPAYLMNKDAAAPAVPPSAPPPDDEDGKAGPPPPPAPADEPEAVQRARRIAAASAKRLIRKEMAALQSFAKRFSTDRAGWREKVEEFYAGHVETVAEALDLHAQAAEFYAVEQRDAVLAGGLAVMETWEVERAAALVALALGEAA